MSPAPDDWHDVALAKLTRVMGERDGNAVAKAALAEAGLVAVTSARDLRKLADVLASRGGFEAAVGGLLAVHATMYGQDEMDAS